MEAVGSELNLFEPFMIQTAVIGEMVQVNLPLHSLFQSVTMKIADKVVTESNNLYPYRPLFETMLNY